MTRNLEKFGMWRGWTFIWGVFFALLPVTSMPLIVRLVGSDVVAAPSGLIAALIFIGWVVPRWLSGSLRFSEGMTPLAVFALYALALTFGRFLLGEDVFYKSANPFRQAVSASLTLIVGLIFYLAAFSYSQSATRLRFALRVINWSGAAVLAWTLLQAFFWYTYHSYPAWLREIQSFVSVGTLFRQRFVGFTLEPSWLAHQLNLLYLPWWLAAAVRNTTAHGNFRRGRLTVELVLLGFGALVLFLTLSRVGLFAFLLVLGVYVVRHLLWGGKGSFRSRWKRLVWVLIGAPLIGLGILWALTKLDYRMRELFQLELAGRSDTLEFVSEKLSLASRFVYWEAGWRVFMDAPVFGVGLGQAGFQLPDQMSPYALTLVEVRDLIFRSDTVLNIKSFWLRLLAETGVIGFSLFFSWIIISAVQSLSLLRGAASKLLRAVGTTALFTLAAFAVEGWSVDTFALPYLWVSLGLSAGAGMIPFWKDGECKEAS